MGNLCCCFPGTSESNPIIDADARRRAAEAAENRLRSYEQSAHGRAAKRIAEANAREKALAARGGGGEPALDGRLAEITGVVEDRPGACGARLLQW
eukprot:CAMPEP_0183357546 /NCGR_PEP_ID=MMETSP0164_2-20130417/46620_1 /TAXON_ID=221442 /ORGANISM="Coccolithus pelagicus ssp braarudi, Strain PLY182g" /LENGTH=95 /DNA_ID=CAMNT_0025531193 /DNA_START=27 /DNA_END=312 /DNA_ORIENTATION=+